MSCYMPWSVTEQLQLSWIWLKSMYW